MSETPAWAVERAKEIAESIFAEWQASCARHPEGYPSPMGLIVERHIASALTIPKDHVRLPSGEVVKVLGTLPMTADRCVVAYGAVVYAANVDRLELIGNGVAWGPVTFSVDTAERYRISHPIGSCYSTRAAAESARAGGGA